MNKTSTKGSKKQSEVDNKCSEPTKKFNPRVGVINVPLKVGEDKWVVCFFKMAGASDVFGINEALNKKAKSTYAKLAKSIGYGSSGLWTSPNPIFWNRKFYRKIRQNTVQLHGRGPNYSKFPGFNDARYANTVILESKLDKSRTMYINVHLAANNANKVPTSWVNAQQKESIRKIKAIVNESLQAGMDVWLEGDFNIKDTLEFKTRYGNVEQIRPKGLDKIYHFTPNRLPVVDHKVRGVVAPTDHKRGWVASPKNG